MNDEAFYAIVVQELSKDGPIPGLWAKAFSECEGNEARAKAHYMKLRVSQLMTAAEKARNAEKAEVRARERMQEREMLGKGFPNQTKHEVEVSNSTSIIAIVIVAILSVVVGFAIKQ